MRRMKKFIVEFPNAVDVIIRGVKAGLPLGDCIRVIAAEAAEPVRSEFRRIVEAQAIGLSVAEAVEKLHDSVPIAEANFFSIVINLQSKSGGNLSEALGNLSRVLRDRKKMALKIKAMSSEAKTSAGIIGAHAVFRRLFRLADDARLHQHAVDGDVRPDRARLLRGLDGHRHFRDAQDDQFRLLTARH